VIGRPSRRRRACYLVRRSFLRRWSSVICFLSYAPPHVFNSSVPPKTSNVLRPTGVKYLSFPSVVIYKISAVRSSLFSPSPLSTVRNSRAISRRRFPCPPVSSPIPLRHRLSRAVSPDHKATPPDTFRLPSRRTSTNTRGTPPSDQDGIVTYYYLIQPALPLSNSFSVVIPRDHGRHGRGDQTAERQETDAGRRVRGSCQFPGNRHTQSNHARCGQETLHRLRSAHASE